MRTISIEEIKGNEIAACDILDTNNRILLTKGSRVKLSYLDKLESLGIYHVYIEDDISEGIKIESLLCEKTKKETKEILEKELKKFSNKKSFDVSTINKISNIIINEILLNRVDLINLKDLRLKDEYLFSHSINVCTLALYLCLKMGFDHSKIQNIGTGCLLHDFGKLLIPKEILYKPSSLTNAESIELKKHPTYGYKALKDDSTIQPTTKVIIYMHHEKLNGSGYPNNLSGDKIHQAVRICSICNVFDSLTSDLPYRKSFSTSYAVEYLTSTSGMYFDPVLVKEFLKYIPIYDEGTIVLLNNGVVAIVVKNNPKHLTRPVVRFLYNPINKIKYRNREVDLVEELTLFIDKEIFFDRNEYDSIDLYQ